MKVVIMGCGRVGAHLATLLDIEGHSITVLDIDAYSFRRLPPEFSGTALVGSGVDQEALRQAGIEESDAFVAVTQGDNRNVMAAQIAKHIFDVSIADLKADYARLNIEFDLWLGESDTQERIPSLIQRLQDFLVALEPKMGIIEPEVEDVAQQEQILEVVRRLQEEEEPFQAFRLRAVGPQVKMGVGHEECRGIAVRVHEGNFVLELNPGSNPEW